MIESAPGGWVTCDHCKIRKPYPTEEAAIEAANDHRCVNVTHGGFLADAPSKKSPLNAPAVTLTDMGRQICVDSKGHEFVGYRTIIGWDCPTCHAQVAATSDVSEHDVMGPASAAAIRHLADSAVAVNSGRLHECVTTVRARTPKGLTNAELLAELSSREMKPTELQTLSKECVKRGAGVQSWLMHWAKKLMGKSVFTENEWAEKVKSVAMALNGLPPVDSRAEDYRRECERLLRLLKDTEERMYPLMPAPSIINSGPLKVDPSLLKFRFLKVVVKGDGSAAIEGYDALPENHGANPTRYEQSQDCRERGPSAVTDAIHLAELRRRERNSLDILDEDLLCPDVETPTHWPPEKP